LRYPIIMQGSRSFIRDPGATTPTANPLFRQSGPSRVASDKLSTAVLWLQRDVEQILKTVGWTYDIKSGILENLFIFFRMQLQPTDMGDLSL